MTVRQALYKARKLGYSTTKSDGTWYISKSYSTAVCIVDVHGIAHIRLNNNGYIKAEDLQ